MFRPRVCTIGLLLALAASAQTSAQLEAALPRLQRANRAAPGDYDTGWNLALAYSRLNRLQEAADQINAMLAREKKAELYNLLGDVEERRGRIIPAAQALQKAAQMEPGERNLNDWGAHLLRFQAWDAALQVYRRAVELHPRSSPLHVGLGVAQYSRSEWSAAIDALCRAVDLDPADERPLDFLGRMIDLVPEKDFEVSLRLKRYAERLPRNPQAQYFYGVSVMVEDPTLAVTLLRRATGLDANFGEAFLKLGITYAGQNRTEEAVAALRRAVALLPNSELAHYRLAQLYQRSGQAALAKTEFAAYRRLHAKRPTSPENRRRPALVVK